MPRHPWRNRVDVASLRSRMVHKPCAQGNYAPIHAHVVLVFVVVAKPIILATIFVRRRKRRRHGAINADLACYSMRLRKSQAASGMVTTATAIMGI